MLLSLNYLKRVPAKRSAPPRNKACMRCAEMQHGNKNLSHLELFDGRSVGLAGSTEEAVQHACSTRKSPVPRFSVQSQPTFPNDRHMHFISAVNRSPHHWLLQLRKKNDVSLIFYSLFRSDQ